MTIAKLVGTVAVYDGPDALASAAAERLAASLSVLARRLGRELNVGFPGGRTPLALFRRLAGPDIAPRVPWNRIRLYWSDERCVPFDNPQSNYGTARLEFLSRTPLPEDRHSPFQTALGAEGAARKADEELRRAAPDGLDILLLGMGADGHTASLFPGSPVLEEDRRWVAATRAPDGLERVTLTFPFLVRCHEIWVLAAGADKRDAVRRALAADVSLPIGRLQAARPLTWLLDRAAAGAP